MSSSMHVPFFGVVVDELLPFESLADVVTVGVPLRTNSNFPGLFKPHRLAHPFLPSAADELEHGALVFG